MALPFAPHRRAPLLVLLTEAGLPFVLQGYGVSDLREDVYDNAFNTAGFVKTNETIARSVFDIAMSGGEPYGHWL